MEDQVSSPTSWVGVTFVVDSAGVYAGMGGDNHCLIIGCLLADPAPLTTAVLPLPHHQQQHLFNQRSSLGCQAKSSGVLLSTSGVGVHTLLSMGDKH